MTTANAITSKKWPAVLTFICLFLWRVQEAVEHGRGGHWTCWGGGQAGGGGWSRGGLTEGKALHRESYGELANKLASGKEGAGEALMVLGGVGIHLARHSCSCLWLSLTASATLLQSTCVCSLAFPQSARKML